MIKLTLSSVLEPIFKVLTATATHVSLMRASPPYTVPNAPMPSLRLRTTYSLAISHESWDSHESSPTSPSSLILSRVAFTFASYLQPPKHKNDKTYSLPRL